MSAARRVDPRQRLVLHADVSEGLSGMSFGVGCHRRQDVADAVRRFALGDEQRPVAADETLVAFARHVGGRHDTHDARLHGGIRGVDARHAGARVRREEKNAAPTCPPPHVVHERALAERVRLGILAGEAVPIRPL